MLRDPPFHGVLAWTILARTQSPARSAIFNLTHYPIEPRLTQRPRFGILSVYISVLKGFRFEV